MLQTGLYKSLNGIEIFAPEVDMVRRCSGPWHIVRGAHRRSGRPRLRSPSPGGAAGRSRRTERRRAAA
jgi:hypothetical protein